MRVILFNRQLQQIGRLIPDLVTPREIEDLTGVNVFYFRYPADAEWADDIVDGYYVVTQDLDNDWQLYEIVLTSNVINDGTAVIEAECKHDCYALDKMEYVALDFTAQPATSAFNQALADTGWQLGTVQVSGVRSTKALPMSPFMAIRELARLWDGELNFRVELSGVTVHAKYVDILIRRGSFTGKRFALGKDLKGIKVTVDRSQVITAMYGWGAVTSLPGEGEETSEERLTLADVEWVKGQPAELYPGGPSAPAPVDKPLGQLWIGDEDAREIYGRLDASTQQMVHVFDEYPSSAQSPQALAWETWRQLQKRVTPLWHAEATVAALEQVPGFEHERVRLGDTNYAILPDMVPIEGRVIKIDRQRKSSDQTIIEMGNFRPGGAEADLEMERRQQRVESRSGIWDRAAVITPNRRLPTSVLDGVIDAAQNQIFAGGGTFRANGDGAWTTDTDDPDTALGAIRQVAFEGKAAIVGGKRNAPIDPWQWRVGFTSDGFRIFGEEVIGGLILGDYLQISSGTTFEEGYDPSQKATPEDVAAVEYTANQQFNAVNLRVDEAEFNVSAVSTVVNSHGLRLSDAEAGITVNAQEITQRVRKDNVISEINQSPEQIRISANRVQITGETVFASGYDPSQKATPEYARQAATATTIDLSRGGALFHFDRDLLSTQGLEPSETPVVTLHPREGKYGGGVAVEEATTNLFPLNRQKFQLVTSGYSGATLIKSENISVPEWGATDATRFETSGGTHIVKFTVGTGGTIGSVIYTMSMYVKNIGQDTARIFANGYQVSTFVDVLPGEVRRITLTGTGNGTSLIQFNIAATTIEGNLDVILWRPQAEQKPFATSFVEGSRGGGYLPYAINPCAGDEFTFLTWVKTRQPLSNAWRMIAGSMSGLTGWYLAWVPDFTRLRFSWRDANASGVQRTLESASLAIPTDQWQQVGVTYNRPTRTAVIYANGVKVAERTNTDLDMVPASGKLGFGTIHGEGSSLPLNGLLDEVLILPHAATAEEIKAWYDLQRPFYDPQGSEARAERAETAAKSHADTKAAEAQVAAEAYALAQADLKAAEAQAAAELAAQGMVSAETQARLNQAQQNLNEAKAYADSAATDAENAAKAYAELKAQEAEDNSQSYTNWAIDQFGYTLGDMAWADMVELAQLGTTIIQGGFLRTDLIQAGSIAAEKLAVNDLSAISGWFSNLSAGVAGGARLELGQSGGPHLDMFDSSDTMRVSLLQDRLNFRDELGRFGGFLRSYRYQEFNLDLPRLQLMSETDVLIAAMAAGGNPDIPSQNRASVRTSWIDGLPRVDIISGNFLGAMSRVIVDNDRVSLQTPRVDMTGRLVLPAAAGSGGNEQIDFTAGYKLFRDDAGAGADGTRLWFDTPNLGEIVFGPRAGGNFLHQIRLRSNLVRVEGNLEITGQMTGSSIVGSNQLRVATSSTSGTLASGGAANIVLHRRAFFPNLHGPFVVLLGSATNTADFIGRFRIENNRTSNSDYIFRWEYMASTNPLVTLLLVDTVTGEIVNATMDGGGMEYLVDEYWHTYQEMIADNPALMLIEPSIEELAAVLAEVPDLGLGSAEDITEMLYHNDQVAIDAATLIQHLCFRDGRLQAKSTN